MSEIADRYRRLCALFVGKVAQVPPEGWDTPSPRDAWTAVGTDADDQTKLLALVGRRV